MSNNQGNNIRMYFKDFLHGKNNIYLKMFISLLVENNILEMFLRERSKAGHTITYMYHKRPESAKTLLSDAFGWQQSEMGYVFWSSINRLWRYRCEALQEKGYYEACKEITRQQQKEV